MWDFKKSQRLLPAKKGTGEDDGVLGKQSN